MAHDVVTSAEIRALQAQARLLRDHIAVAEHGIVGQDNLFKYRSELAMVEAKITRLRRANRA
jgi:hypothetical protein